MRCSGMQKKIRFNNISKAAPPRKARHSCKKEETKRIDNHLDKLMIVFHYSIILPLNIKFVNFVITSAYRLFLIYRTKIILAIILSSRLTPQNHTKLFAGQLRLACFLTALAFSQPVRWILTVFYFIFRESPFLLEDCWPCFRIRSVLSTDFQLIALSKEHRSNTNTFFLAALLLYDDLTLVFLRISK